jgi:hypothetical protein
MAWKSKDWKECLREEDKKELAEILDLAAKHRCAYCQAKDVKIAQLWCALFEVWKELKEVREKVELVIKPFEHMVEIGEAAKRQAIEDLTKELIRPKSEAEKEAVRKLVDSLMKF